VTTSVLLGATNEQTGIKEATFWGDVSGRVDFGRGVSRRRAGVTMAGRRAGQSRMGGIIGRGWGATETDAESGPRTTPTTPMTWRTPTPPPRKRVL
jgi:hypothetical protein